MTLLNQRLTSKHSVCRSNVSEYHRICTTKPCTALELEDIANQPGTFHILLCLQFMPSLYILWWPKNGIIGCSNWCEWNGAETRGGCIANKWFLNDLASRRYQRYPKVLSSAGLKHHATKAAFGSPTWHSARSSETRFKFNWWSIHAHEINKVKALLSANMASDLLRVCSRT